MRSAIARWASLPTSAHAATGSPLAQSTRARSASRSPVLRARATSASRWLIATGESLPCTARHAPNSRPCAASSSERVALASSLTAGGVAVSAEIPSARASAASASLHALPSASIGASARLAATSSPVAVS